MTVLADWQIQEEGLVEPFTNAQCEEGIITYGVSSYGYDVRAGSIFRIFSESKAAQTGQPIDPKRTSRIIKEFQKAAKAGPDGLGKLPQDPYTDEVIGPVCNIPANSFALTYSVERILMKRDMLATVIGKSTYARHGLIVNVTPLEPEWKGNITIELSNTCRHLLTVWANEGIAQVVFHRADGPYQLAFRKLDELTRELAALALVWDHPDTLSKMTKLSDEYQKTLCKVSYADKGGRYQNQGPNVVFGCVRGENPLHSDGTPGTLAGIQAAAAEAANAAG